MLNSQKGRDLQGKKVGVHPSDIEISKAHTGFDGTVETIGFEGKNYRVSVKYEDDQILQVLAKYSEEKRSIKPGDRISLEMKRKITITEN